MRPDAHWECRRPADVSRRPARPGAGAGVLRAQAPAAPLKVRGLSQLTLTVSDLPRSLRFYQELFGMPIQARQGPTLFLRIGAGPQFLALRPAAAGERPGISGFGMAVDDFSIERVVSVLGAHGVTRAPRPRTAPRRRR